MPPETDDTPAPTNRLAIIALLTAILGLALLAIGFAVAALVQLRRRAERGRSLAIAALALSTAWLVAGAVLLAATAEDENAPPEGPRASALSESGCFGGFRQAGTKIFANAVPCAAPHEGEVVAKLYLAEFPGDARSAAEVEKACRARAASLYAGRSSDEFALFTDRPDEEDWRRGEHAATCLLRYTDGPKSVPLNELPKALSELAAGDCVGKWSGSGFVYLVDCGKRHEVQVFARITPKGDDYPDEARAYVLCADQARRVFGQNPPEHLRMRYAGPDELAWARGERFVACLITSKKGLLTHSMLPN
ncbi:DUF4190 domain-containing protein [Actinomadura monticuli]|uniref:Septum formation family protein n=1 Tax=Actinomadura monticuli TaxID=3097367 RepID=A0ABV4Q7N3_9ACTN